jgi:hypothetical protein
MGFWGSDSFDNDAALDWIHELEREPTIAFVESTLTAAIDDDDPESEPSWIEAQGIAAAELVAALCSRPHGKLPVEYWLLHQLREEGVTSDGLRLARSAVDAVRDRNGRTKTTEPWSQEYEEWNDQWLSTLADLSSRLEAASPSHPDPPGVFLSHTWRDKPFARRLAADLTRLGARVWIDEAEIKLGDSLIEKIRSGIDEMDYLAVILSPASVDSPWVQREVDIAMNQEIEGKRVKVLPLVYKKCDLPVFLKGKLYADFSQPKSYSSGLDLIADRLGFSRLKR